MHKQDILAFLEVTLLNQVEHVGGRSGIGFLIILGMNQYKPAMIIAGMVVIALTAWFITFAMERLEKLVCPWRRDIRV